METSCLRQHLRKSCQQEIQGNNRHCYSLKTISKLAQRKILTLTCGGGRSCLIWCCFWKNLFKAGSTENLKSHLRFYLMLFQKISKEAKQRVCGSLLISESMNVWKRRFDDYHWNPSTLLCYIYLSSGLTIIIEILKTKSPLKLEIYIC